MAKNIQNSIKKQKSGLCTISPKAEHEYGQKINPLFVEVILENIFSYLKKNNKSTSLSEYRLVCKFWEQEIIKMIRRETHIKLHKILTPYPDGYGWTTVRGANQFHYKLPYSQVYPFQNVELDLIYKWSIHYKYQPPDEDFENWFKLMGHQVKSLIFSCSLTSSQIDYYELLERILKEWCPNLERLTLKDIRLVEGLVFASFFKDSTKEIICKGLNELTIHFDHNEDFTWPRPDRIPNIVADPKPLNQFIYNHGLPESKAEFPEIFNANGVKVTVPREIYAAENLPDISTLFPTNFFPKYLDEGILGQLIKCTKLKKLRLEGPMKPINRKHLAAFFHYRKNNWKTSLKHLELDWRSMESLSKELVVLGRVQFPVVTLKLTTATFKIYETASTDMTRFLSCFSETLQHLQFDVIEDEEYSTELILPILPNLKTFALDRLNVYQLSAFNLVTNAPNLEKCYLKGYKWHRRGKDSGVIDTFFEGYHSNVSNNKLKDFRLVGVNVHFSGIQASNILDWFPNVRQMELIGMVDDNRGMSTLLRKLADSEVTDFKMSWSKNAYKGSKDSILEDTTLIQEFGKIQNLRTLEVTFDDDKLPFHVTPVAFQNGYGKLSNLRLLKLTNFGVYLDEKQEVIKYLDHILVVQLLKMAYLRQTSARKMRKT